MAGSRISPVLAIAVGLGGPVYIVGVIVVVAYLSVESFWVAHRIQQGHPFNYRIQAAISVLVTGAFLVAIFLQSLRTGVGPNAFWILLIIAWIATDIVLYRRFYRLNQRAVAEAHRRAQANAGSRAGAQDR